jgi:hypothetical protein
MLAAVEQITPAVLPLNAYSLFMTAIDHGLREPWTPDGVDALRRLVGAPDTGEDPVRETVLLGRLLAHLTSAEARRVREVCCRLLPLPPADLSGISPAFAAAVTAMRRARERDRAH